MTPPLLEVRHLARDYGAMRALAGVSFQVEPGEIFGLLGPNGAGKTTLLSILAGLLRPTSGEILFDGQPLSGTSLEQRRAIGIVPQDLALYAELSARENLQFFGSLYGLREPALSQRTATILEAIGLADRANDRVRTFSGGMKRRLNLGAALVHEPRLLLLDEPTVGVDPQSRNHIFEEVRRLNAQGMTIVYTSHYMEEVQALCRRIGIIDHGQLIACDTLAALLATLPGQIHLHVAQIPDALPERLAQLADIQLKTEGEMRFLLECSDVKNTVLRLVGVLNELQVEITALELREPSLEGVFLHLTGKALRD